MQHVCKGTVVRYDLPGLLALNFILTATLGTTICLFFITIIIITKYTNVIIHLGGGGLSSMIIDRQGKTYAQLLLTGLEIEIPSNLVRFSKL